MQAFLSKDNRKKLLNLLKFYRDGNSEIILRLNNLKRKNFKLQKARNLAAN